MAQETRVEETRCSLQTFERNRYFYGKPMTVSDFEAEQRYLIGKHRYINRLVHGAGVLCGLQVTLPGNFSNERPTIELAEGAALDCCGNLIVNSRSSTVEIKGDFDPDGLNYLYIKYNECSKQPVMLAANGSSCEEVCCYNRIQETFEIVASPNAPFTIEAAPPAVAAPAKKVAAGETLPTPTEVCRALTENYYQEHLRTCPGCDDPLVFLAVLDPEKVLVDETESAKYRSVVYNNPMLHELLCEHVTDYNNPHHTSAEQVRALQSVNGVGNGGTKAHVANIDLRSKDNTLVITPEKNEKRIDLILGPDSVKGAHLSEDVINHLLQTSETVSVEPNVATKSIKLRTTRAASVTSVGSKQKVGTSNNFAPEDHAHDLSEGVVERKHLNPDVYANLLQGSGNIKVEPDAAAQTIRISAEVEVSPSDDLRQLSSVTGTKQLGRSKRYAREDHAHDLHINGRAPNEKGEFLLTPGANVRIEKGAVDNELVISAEGGGQSLVTTGIFIFEDVRPQELRTSTLIAHKLDAELVAIVLAEEESDNIRGEDGQRLNALRGSARFGDFAAFFEDAPFLMAEVDYGQKTIQISLKDRRQGSRFDNTTVRLADESDFKFAASGAAAPHGETDPSGSRDPSGFLAPTGSLPPPETGGDIIIDPDARTYRVRWWAIPA